MVSMASLKSIFDDYQSSDSSSDEDIPQATSRYYRSIKRRTKCYKECQGMSNHSDSSDLTSSDDVSVESECVSVRTQLSNSHLTINRSLRYDEERLSRRRQDLKKIEDTWFDSTDDSSDFSDDSSDWTSCSSLQRVIIKTNNSKPGKNSCEDETSGYFEGSVTGSLTGKCSPSLSRLSSDDCFSECDTSKTNLPNNGRELDVKTISRGFGLNKWYSPKQEHNKPTSVYKWNMENNHNSNSRVVTTDNCGVCEAHQGGQRMCGVSGFGRNKWYTL